MTAPNHPIAAKSKSVKTPKMFHCTLSSAKSASDTTLMDRLTAITQECNDRNTHPSILSKTDRDLSRYSNTDGLLIAKQAYTYCGKENASNLFSQALSEQLPKIDTRLRNALTLCMNQDGLMDLALTRVKFALAKNDIHLYAGHSRNLEITAESHHALSLRTTLIPHRIGTPSEITEFQSKRAAEVGTGVTAHPSPREKTHYLSNPPMMLDVTYKLSRRDNGNVAIEITSLTLATKQKSRLETLLQQMKIPTESVKIKHSKLKHPTIEQTNVTQSNRFRPKLKTIALVGTTALLGLTTGLIFALVPPVAATAAGLFLLNVFTTGSTAGTVAALAAASTAMGAAIGLFFKGVEIAGKAVYHRFKSHKVTETSTKSMAPKNNKARGGTTSHLIFELDDEDDSLATFNRTRTIATASTNTDDISDEEDPPTLDSTSSRVSSAASSPETPRRQDEREREVKEPNDIPSESPGPHP